MKRFGKIALATLILAGAVMITPQTVSASPISDVLIEDDFSSTEINAKEWTVNGENISVVDTDGALVMQTLQGYSHSILYQAVTFESGQNYTVEFDAEAKHSSEVWLGIVIGAQGVGATYESKSSNGVLLSTQNTGTRVDNYLGGVLQNSERFTFPDWTNSGAACSFKFDFRKMETAYALDLYVKDPEAADYGEKRGTLTIGDIEGYLAFQANGDGSTVKIKNLKVYKGTELVDSETFDKPTQELICFSSDRTGWRWVAQNECYSCGLGKVVKYSAAENNGLVSVDEIKKSQGNIDIFDLSITFEMEEAEEKNGFGVTFGVGTQSESGLYFVKKGEKYSLLAKTAETEIVLAETLELKGENTISFVGKYNGKIEVRVGANVYVAELPFVGKFAITTYGTATVSLHEAKLIQNDYVICNSEKISNNFNAKKNGSSTVGYLDESKWVAIGNCALRSDVLKFQSGDIYTSFNTADKYQDYILRFDVTKITASYTRDEEDAYTVPGTYADMSLGVSIGKQSYDESSISGEHPSIQFCTKYWNKEGDLTIPNMIIWGYGIQTATGESAAWPQECWWHDGSDGKVVTGTDKLAINVMIVAKNRTVKVYYKYSNQPDSYMDTPKAVFTNVNTYGYVAISCGYNSTFEVDNLSIVPLSFENYL